MEPPPPEYFTDEAKIVEDYSIEELKGIFSDQKSSKFVVSYTKPLKQTLGPKQWGIKESLTHYFISPTKFIIRGFVENFGFTFWDCFNPMNIQIVEQLYDKKKNSFKIEVKMYARVNFVKSVMFFQNKIKTEAKKEVTSVYPDIYTPLVKEYLKEFQPKFVRAVPKSKKKLTKVAKLKLELEDLQTEHEEVLAKLSKDHEKEMGDVKDQLEEVKQDFSALETKAKIMAAALAIIGVVFILRIFYWLLF